MKNNTANAKNFLIQALKNLPDDFALNEVKTHINLAVQKIELVENKRQKREENYIKKSQNIKPILDPLYIIKAIDEELSKEQKKLEEIKRSKKTQKEFDDEDFGTVFG